MAEGELHKRLVRHLADTLAATGLEVETHASVHRPDEVFRSVWTSGHFPDVVGRTRRRVVYGDAKRHARDVEESLSQLRVFAARGRQLVICVPEGELRETAEMLTDEWGRHYRRLRLLGDQSSHVYTVHELL
jgi:hypothetical protein